MLLNDVVKLIPKSWLAKEHIAHVNFVSCASLEALDTACCESASSVSIANYTETANLTHSEIFPGVVALHNEVRFPFSGYRKSPKYFQETLFLTK